MEIDFGEKHLGFSGRDHATANAIKESKPYFSLERRDASADRRLRHAQQFGSASGAAGRHQGPESLKVSVLHGRRPIRFSS
jgi:hypothetical protein